MEQFDIKINELEFKYKADQVKLSDFRNFADSLSPRSMIQVSSYDTYYSGPQAYKEKGLEFVRFRHGDKPELTIKIKTSDKNNNTRIEIDLPLAKKATKFIVDKWLGWFGFKENFEIFKECDIFFYEKVDIVYYTVKESDCGKILGNFIEIEARKDAKFSSYDEAWNYVEEMEKKMAVLGLKPANRMKRSMWEIFRRDSGEL